MGNLSKHFDSSEFACQCGCGDDRIDPELVDLLEEIRVALDRPVRITSGVRCQSHNESIGGVAKSAHVPVDLFDGKGPVSRAVDIAVPDSRYRYAITPLLWSRFQRIGFGKSFYHVDTNPNVSNDVMWDYYRAAHVA